MLSSPQKQRAVSLSSIAEPHGVYGADCIAVQKQIKHYQLLQATLSVLYDQSGAAQRSWSRNSNSRKYLRKACADFVTEFRSELGDTMCNMIKDYVQIKQLRRILQDVQRTSTVAQNQLQLDLKADDTQRRQQSRLSLQDYASGSMRPDEHLLDCHLRDSKILRAVVGTHQEQRVETSPDHPDNGKDDWAAIQQAGAALSEELLPYLPASASLLQTASSLVLLGVVLDGVIKHIEDLKTGRDIHGSTLQQQSNNTARRLVMLPTGSRYASQARSQLLDIEEAASAQSDDQHQHHEEFDHGQTTHEIQSHHAQYRR